jgi:hypothetical protein
MEDVVKFYGHLVHLTVFCYILWTFGVVRGILVYFSRFGILCQEKSGNPESATTQLNVAAAHLYIGCLCKVFLNFFISTTLYPGLYPGGIRSHDP